MLYSIVGFQDDGIWISLCFHTEWTVHMWWTMSTLGMNTEHRFKVILRTFDAYTWMSLGTKLRTYSVRKTKQRGKQSFANYQI